MTEASSISKNPYTQTSGLPLNIFSDELLYEVITHMDQRTKLAMSLVSFRFHKLANKSIYRQIYLNDCCVVESKRINLANKWTVLYLPALIDEKKSRSIADKKLCRLLATFDSKPQTTLIHVEWVRINWDLNKDLQRTIVERLCNGAPNLVRLENVIDPSCYNIIAQGKYSNRNSSLRSFDMAPPNSSPGDTIDDNYLPNFYKFLDSRLYNNIDNITTLTLFIDPVILFGLNNYLDQEINFGLYPKLLRGGKKLYIKDLKLHWRLEFFPMNIFQLQQKATKMTLPKLSDLFDARTLETLTIISWEEEMEERNKELLKQVADFHNLKDLSLISLQQSFAILQTLFDGKNMPDLKRLKFDFLDSFGLDNASPLLLRVILDNCKKLEYLDIRSNEFLIQPIVSLRRSMDNGTNNREEYNQQNLRLLKFGVTQQCYCPKCCDYFNNFLTKTLFPKELDFNDINYMKLHEFFFRDIFKLMKHYGLFPYSKASDIYPSVRTQPMNISEFVKKFNLKLVLESAHPFMRALRGNMERVYKKLFYTIFGALRKVEQEGELSNDYMLEQKPFAKVDQQIANEMLPGDEYKSHFITGVDVVRSVHTLMHHNKKPYEYILAKLPNLKFLVFNDLPVAIVEESVNDTNFGRTKTRRRVQPAFFSSGYDCNLYSDFESNKNTLIKSTKADLALYKDVIFQEELGGTDLDFKEEFGPYLIYPKILVEGVRKLGSISFLAASLGYPKAFMKLTSTDSMFYNMLTPFEQESNESSTDESSDSEDTFDELLFQRGQTESVPNVNDRDESSYESNSFDEGVNESFSDQYDQPQQNHDGSFHGEMTIDMNSSQEDVDMDNSEHYDQSDSHENRDAYDHEPNYNRSYEDDNENQVLDQYGQSGDSDRGSSYFEHQEQDVSSFYDQSEDIDNRESRYEGTQDGRFSREHEFAESSDYGGQQESTNNRALCNEESEDSEASGDL
ncbi:hypothetical protein ACO0QE_001349 [Hanseniaspora vineae]